MQRLRDFNRRTLDVIAARIYFYLSWAHENAGSLADIRSELMAAHKTAVLRHDAIGQETLLNLLLRSYLHYNLYDQVRAASVHIGSRRACCVAVSHRRVCTTVAAWSPLCCTKSCSWPPPFQLNTYVDVSMPFSQAEKFRSKAQKADTFRSPQQYCRYLYYLGRIRAIQLEYSEAKDCLQQVSGWAMAVITTATKMWHTVPTSSFSMYTLHVATIAEYSLHTKRCTCNIWQPLHDHDLVLPTHSKPGKFPSLPLSLLG